MIKVRIRSKDFKDLPFNHLETTMPESPEINDDIDFRAILGEHFETFATKFGEKYEPMVKVSHKTWISYPDESVLEIEGTLLKIRKPINYKIGDPSVH